MKGKVIDYAALQSGDHDVTIRISAKDTGLGPHPIPGTAANISWQKGAVVAEDGEPGWDKGKRFKEFTKRARLRLEHGAAEYGGKNFSAAPTELIRELQEECLDLAGWGFILFERLENMKEIVDLIHGRIDPPEGPDSPPAPADDPRESRRARVQWSAMSNAYMLLREAGNTGWGHDQIVSMSRTREGIEVWAREHGWEVVE